MQDIACLVLTGRRLPSRDDVIGVKQAHWLQLFVLIIPLFNKLFFSEQIHIFV